MKGALFGARLAVLGAATLSLFLGGCGSGEVFFPSGGGGAGASTSTQGGGGSTGSQGGGGSAGSQGGGGTSSQGGSTATQGGGGTVSQGGGGSTGECATPADCDAVKGGPAACGQWSCNMGVCIASSPGCTDDDHDGYGGGVACSCAGLDCDDADPAITTSAQTSCYSAPAATDGVGACHSGVTTCTAGIWGPCSGEVTPSGEACNNQDDDCDGTADDNLGSFVCGLGACQKTVAACNGGVTGQCVPNAPASATDGPGCNGIDDDCDGAVDEDCHSCVAVNFASLSAAPDGTTLNPFAAIQPAIDWAVAHPNGPQTVCVAAGAQCGQTGTYKTPNGATIVMANGVSVLGNYESVTWNRCGNSTTVIQPQTSEGVTFPAAVVKTTVLDGFRIERFNSGANGTTAGVTITGAKSVILSSVAIPELGGLNVMKSYGVNMTGGAEATITKSRIDAGFGSAESIGVRTVASKVAIQNNCLSLDVNGRCDDACGNNPSIRGRTQQGTGVTYAVLLQDAPSSTIETSALCATDADQGASIRIAGDGANVLIRGNFINAFGGLQDSHGIWMEDCGGAKPWIVDNFRIATTGDNQNSRVDGIRAIGDCHPVVDSNAHITGGGEGNAANPIGVYCGANANGVASKCVVLGNRRIEGSIGGFPVIATGVRCDDGGCNRIAGNTITGRGGLTAYGVWLGATGAVVDNNEIRGGCGGITNGVRTEDSFARIQNNRIFGYWDKDCQAGGNNGNPTESFGMRVVNAATSHEVDVHSNDVDGTGLSTSNVCVSRAVGVDLAPQVVAASRGIFRNNILRAGTCATSRVGFLELLAGADPRIVENNDFDPTGAPTAFYIDENMMALTAAQVDMLADITAGGNISMDPLFANYPLDFHLQMASPCVGAGTPVGAPLTDFEGTMRDPATPDIGADER